MRIGVSAAAVAMLGLASWGCGGGVSTPSGNQGAGGTGSGSSGTGTGTSTGTTGTSSSGSGSSSSGGGGIPSDWQTLIAGEWSLAGGSEGYVCVAVTMQETIWVKAFRPINPEGTHHTVLTKGGFGSGTFPCDASTNGENMIFGSGLGTETMEMPEGVAMRLEEGTTLLLNLHLYNVNGTELSGLSGTEILQAHPDEVMHEAVGTLAGTLNISIPPQSQGSASGSCTFHQPTTLFGVGPHMHQTGTHMTVTAMQGGGNTVLHDAPYTFDDQLIYPVEPGLTINPGDSVRIDCSYDNPTSSHITWGDSSDQEMCFASLWTYPPAGTGFTCTN